MTRHWKAALRTAIAFVFAACATAPGRPGAVAQEAKRKSAAAIAPRRAAFQGLVIRISEGTS